MKSTIEDVKNMTDGKLREKILFFNNQQLKLIKEASYISIFSGLKDLQKQLIFLQTLDYFKKSEDYQILVNSLKDLIEQANKSIEPTYNGDMDFDKERELLNEFSSSSEGYYIELSYAGMLIEQQINKMIAARHYSDFPYDDELIYTLTDKIKDSLMTLQDDYENYIYVISQVIKALPMRLTKDNYYDVVKKSLINSHGYKTQYELEKQIKKLKKVFDSSIQDGHGIKFDYFFQQIHKYRNINYTEKSLDELIKTVEEIKKLESEILHIYDFIVGMGGIVNKFIVIDKISEDIDLSRVKDIYNQWIGLLGRDNDEELTGKFTGDVTLIGDKIQTELFSYLEEFNRLSTEAANRKEFDFKNINNEIENTTKILMYFGDLEFVDGHVLSLDNKKVVDSDYLSQTCDSLITYVNRSIKGMSNLERKIRMRNLLSSIELPFEGVDEFLDYVSYSLDIKVTSNEERNLTFDYLYQLLSDMVEDVK